MLRKVGGVSTIESSVTRAAASLDPERLLAVVSDLIRIPSVNDGESTDVERPVADYLCALFDEWELEYDRWDVAPGRPNIVVDIDGVSDGPTLIFEGHMDVVTPGDPARWSRDPFSGMQSDGLIHGRGSADMKAGLAAMIFAAHAISESGVVFPGRIRLAILSDEEGMMIGAKDFVARGYLDGAGGVISCEPEGGRVCVAQKGAIRLQVDLHGRMTHGCMPEEGANPVAAMGLIVQECQLIERRFAEIAGEHPFLGKFYFTPTVAIAGTPNQANVVTNQARLYIDVRTTPSVDHTEVIDFATARFESRAFEIDGVKVDVEVLDDRPSTETDPCDPVVQAVIAEHRRVHGEDPPLGGVPGSTDATIFWAATGVPVAVYGPGDTTIPHQVDEFVRSDEVVTCAQVYVGAALRFLYGMDWDA